MKNTFKNTFNTEEGILDNAKRMRDYRNTYLSTFILQQISFVLIK